MPDSWARRRVEALLRPAGVAVGGYAPHDIDVHNAAFFRRVLAGGSLAFGETYVDGWWDARQLDDCLSRLLAAELDMKVEILSARVRREFVARLRNAQAGLRRMRVAEVHYDLGNDLYAAMLGARLVYSCGYWAQAETLDDAQLAKLDLIARKLDLQPGMRVLDVGCGWGEALKYFAVRYGITGVGVTISRQQAEYGEQICKGLPVTIKLCDYREVGAKFDRVFSIGMFEHVGYRNYAEYFATVRDRLEPDGLLLLHSIGSNVSTHRTDPWIERYIFPNSMLPSATQITHAFEGRFVLEDWHSFGPDYDRTLRAWRANIEEAWSCLPARYDERFRRMWRYYLSASMAAFRVRQAQLWQLVLSPNGVPGGYRSVR
ncbi:cyclopropane fatty acyl phospholipid synthase [Lysobacter sp. TY2-98]|uniref:cyclopropane fatty acyl phospholipid synthase n=1 Tax=Lysobacter sp. TY2-98 TaxID=2290922 RepID=UPI000E20AA71|nr:cyclopropane fatty acyl phospholipid synthase [Lysobacter sp. TY2-98]AXK71026.1 cyclopropane fatty acyl phospholipid synthase [Lysobacter sp. TY2-98]